MIETLINLAFNNPRRWVSLLGQLSALRGYQAGPKTIKEKGPDTEYYGPIDTELALSRKTGLAGYDLGLILRRT